MYEFIPCDTLQPTIAFCILRSTRQSISFLKTCFLSYYYILSLNGIPAKRVWCLAGVTTLYGAYIFNFSNMAAVKSLEASAASGIWTHQPAPFQKCWSYWLLGNIQCELSHAGHVWMDDPSRSSYCKTTRKCWFGSPNGNMFKKYQKMGYPKSSASGARKVSGVVDFTSNFSELPLNFPHLSFRTWMALSFRTCMRLGHVALQSGISTHAKLSNHFHLVERHIPWNSRENQKKHLPIGQ